MLLALVLTRMPFLCHITADTTSPAASRKSSSAVSITSRLVTWQEQYRGILQQSLTTRDDLPNHHLLHLSGCCNDNHH